MNYRNENATPRDRYCGECFSEKHNASDAYHRQNNCDYAKEEYRGSCNKVYNQINHTVHKRSNTNYCPITRNSTNGVCGRNNGYLTRETPIAMVYSPVQVWKELYDPETGLINGTIFKELDLPFYPISCRRKENSSCQCR